MESGNNTRSSFKNQLYTIAIAILLYVALVSLPYGSWIKDSNWSNFTITMIRLGSLIGFYFYFKYYQIKKDGLPSRLNIFLFIPFFIMCFSNLIFLLFTLSFPWSMTNSLYVLNWLIYALCTALVEEYLFRFGLINVLYKKFSKEWTLLISSAVFALLHLVNLFSGSSVGVTFAQVGYTFVLGLILGFLYLYGGGHFWLVVLYHFCFNFFNDYLFILLYQGEWDYRFYVTNIVIGVVVLAYGVFLYFLDKQKGLVSTKPLN
jgi:membrane protease YdiL (CAAX protease family)